ncbi:MAG: DUF2167 domain-containing protein [Gammaproteobacteria bacterium]|nr:DUF2167 domain-containing protein [Gammaproteobacteria bacterium]
MIEIKKQKIALSIDEKKLKSLSALTDTAAQLYLSKLWDTHNTELLHYMAVFYNKDIRELSEKDSFITISFLENGYMIDTQEPIDIVEAQKQIEIDLEIINRESQWGKEDSIYFDQWWPQPKFNSSSNILEFGVSLKDFNQNVFNRTVNRIKLTRFGYISINYSLSEKDIFEKKPLSYYQERLDEVCSAINVKTGYRFKDVDEDNDLPSRSRMINLLLSSEIF